MRNEYELFWICGQKMLQNFLIPWKSEQENLAGYFTKYHSAEHHKPVHLIYLYMDTKPCSVPLVLLNPDLQGCADQKDSKMEEFRKTSPITQIE